jgi:hypothetical protein
MLKEADKYTVLEEVPRKSPLSVGPRPSKGYLFGDYSISSNLLSLN